MMKFKHMLTLFMILVFMSLSVVNSFALVKDYSINKIDDTLEQRLKDIDDDEKITVSIWFNDIDYNDVYYSVVESLNKKRINNDALDSCVKLAFDAQDLALEDIQRFSSVNTEDFNLVLQEKRVITSEKYTQFNNQQVEDIKDLLNDSLQSDSIVFISRYSPNIELTLTKDQIQSITRLSNVVSVNSISELSRCMDENIENTGYQINPKFYDVVGIPTVRDAFGLTGRNMKVGMLEYGGLVNTTAITTNEIYHVYGKGTKNDIHASTVAKIMVGNIDGYVGAIPNAELYYASCNKKIENLKPAIEALIDEGVTAINCSFGFASSHNLYSDIAKWYDHVSTQHSVHMILAAGNFGVDGVCSDNMSYNAIVVGNCYNCGEIFNESSYNTVANTAYKPDIVAPGVNIFVLPSYQADSGTSFSAPLVTSAVIQLAEINPVLCSSPTLMKALLLSSSKITDAMLEEPMISTPNNSTIAFSREYGAGMLRVDRAYTAIHDKGYYFNGTATPELSSFTYSKNITKSVGKTVRVCLTWDKITNVSGNHSNSILTEAQLDTFRLKITTPSGVLYSSDYLYDNKQMISFVSTENGVYNFTVERISATTSNNEIDYAIAFSIN